MNRYKFVTLIVVSMLVAILLASALNGFSRMTDSALADVAPGAGGITPPLQNAPRTTAGKNYLPIIFLNSASAGGAWLLSGNNGTNPASDFLGTADAQPLIVRTNNAERLRVNASGNVGIGTTSPSAKFTVSGAGTYDAAGAARFDLYNTTAGDGFLQHVLNDGTWQIANINSAGTIMQINPSGAVRIGPANLSATQLSIRSTSGNAPLDVKGTSGNAALHVYDDGRVEIYTLASSTTTHACYSGLWIFAGCSSAAEYVPSIDGGMGFPEIADLVSLTPSVKNPYDDKHAPFVVTKSNKPCDDNLLGFIVNPESGADGEKLNDHYLPLAIYGYFPAKVTLENGAIKRGDALTSSSKPGYAMKATQACKIIGYALEDADEEGTFQVFANHGEDAAPEVAALRSQVKEMKEQNATLKEQLATYQNETNTRLAALEQGAGTGNGAQENAFPFSRDAWFIGAVVVVVGIVIGRRKGV